MDALRLLREIRDVLGPMLCGLSDDDPVATLQFVAEQLREYQERIMLVLQEEERDDDNGEA